MIIRFFGIYLFNGFIRVVVLLVLGFCYLLILRIEIDLVGILIWDLLVIFVKLRIEMDWVLDVIFNILFYLEEVFFFLFLKGSCSWVIMFIFINFGFFFLRCLVFWFVGFFIIKIFFCGIMIFKVLTFSFSYLTYGIFNLFVVVNFN